MKSTKKSLLLSTLSLVLCFAMLLGTTWAWFTDSVTSGVNQIVAGNLDVELYHQSKKVSETKVTETTENLFKDVELWEPGAYCYETFTVKNVGNLALKYKMALNVVGYTSYKGHNLTEVIKVATTDTVPTQRSDVENLTYTAMQNWKLDSTDTDTALDAGATKTFTVVLYWAPNDSATDNLYNMNNGKTNEPLTIDLGVELVATQQTNESDSFGPDYDQYATNTIATVLPSENVIVPVEVTEQNTLKEDVTINAEKSDASITAPAGTKLAEGATTLGFKLEPKANPESGVTVGDPTEESAVCYNITVDGLAPDNDKPLTAKINVGAGMTEVNVYHNGQTMEEVNIETNLADGKYYYDSESGNVMLMSKSFSPFDFIVKDGKIHLYDASQLKAFAAKVNGGDTYVGKTVVLENNIDLQNIAWTPIGKSGAPFNGTFDGQNHTVSNLKVIAGDRVGLFGYTFNHATIKDVKVKSAELVGEHYAGAILGQGYASISGCHVEDVTVTVAPAKQSNGNYDNGDKAGGIVGQLGEGETMGIENCSAKNVIVQGYRDIGGIIGMVHDNNYLKNNTADNVTLIQDNTNGYQSTDPTTVGGIYGREGANVVKEENTATNVNVSKVLSISTVDELKAFAESVNGGKTYSNITVYLTKDIDLKNEAWTPIGSGANGFNGTFDGQNHTISNLVVSGEKKVGLFGQVGGTVQNLNVDGAKVQGINAVGTICGLSYYGDIINCTVKNATVTSSVKNDDDGDKVGGVVGRLSVEEGTGSVKNCTAENVTVQGLRQVGGVLGGAYKTSGSYDVSGNTAKNSTIIFDGTNAYGSYATMTDVREVIGTPETLNSSNTATNVTIMTMEADGLIADTANKTYYVSNANGMMAVRAKLVGGSISKDDTVKLDADIDMTGKTWTSVECHADAKQKGFKEFDGQGHTVSNLTINGQGLFTRVATDHAITIKNVTFDNAKNNTSTLNVSLVTAQVYSDLTLDNVKVVNSEFKGTYKVAPLVGTVYNENTSTVTLTVKDCTVENCTVEGTSYNFDICGMVAFVYIEDNDRVVFEGNNVVKDVQLIKRTGVPYDMYAKIWHDGGTAHDTDPNVTVTNVNIVTP